MASNILTASSVLHGSAFRVRRCMLHRARPTGLARQTASQYGGGKSLAVRWYTDTPVGLGRREIPSGRIAMVFLQQDKLISHIQRQSQQKVECYT